MCRCSREKVENGIYHICVRGNNRQDIFQDDIDRQQYLMRVRHYLERYKMHIYAYCLMTNHVHLLVYDNGEDISKFMQGLSLSYVIYFNSRYARSGHLFQGRFTSVLIKSEAQLVQTAKYIHLNPVKAGIVNEVGQYRWSSYNIYLGKKDELGIVDTKFMWGARDILINERICQDGDGRGDEIASAQEEAQLNKKKDKGIKRLEYEKACTVIKEKIKDLDRRNVDLFDETKGVFIYLVGLISRESWSEIGRRMNFSEAIIYQEIKKISSRMVDSPNFCKSINKIIYSV